MSKPTFPEGKASSFPAPSLARDTPQQKQIKNYTMCNAKATLTTQYHIGELLHLCNLVLVS